MGDLYYDKVVLLLPMSGADEGTTFTDWSKAPKTVTRNGNAKTETGQYKYYGSSGYFDGTDDYLSLADSDDYYFSGDFTIETWVRLSALPSLGSGSDSIKMLYSQRSSDSIRVFFGIAYFQGIHSSPGFWFQVDNSSSIIGLTPSLSGAIGADTWHHCAVSCTSGAVKVFLDGVSVASGSLSGSMPNISAGPTIGIGWTTTFDFAGYMQDFRITKGVGRYTDTFTPPGRLVGTISGTVTDANGDPAARKIVAWPRVIHPPTVALTYTTTSSAVDGTYSLGPMPDAEYARVVLADESTLVNDIVDRVFPG